MNKDDLLKLAEANSLDYREVEDEEMNFYDYWMCIYYIKWC